MIQIQKIDEVYMRVYIEDLGVETEVADHFTFDYPGAKYTPQYRARIWDGKIRLYDVVRKTLYTGLLDRLLKFAGSRDYPVEYVNEVKERTNVSLEEVTEYATSLNLHGRGAPIDIRDYQLDAIHTALSDERCVLLSPTGSGKSLIIYTLGRWHVSAGRRLMVVVPTTSLVEQMYTDFEDYSSKNGWVVADHCQKLYSGFPRTIDKSILFTTWQSIFKQPSSWLNQFDVIVGDEAHSFKAKSLTTIMEGMPSTRYRIGTTGSLDNKKINQLVLEGIFGPVHRVTTTKALQDQGKLAPLNIVALMIKHPERICQALAKARYQEEIEYLVECDERNRLLCNLALSTKGNTLMLFQFVEKHGRVLYDELLKRAGDRKVYFIHGKTDTLDREAIRKILSTETDAIVVASFGTSSTGINIPSIQNIIFASPTKSVIRVLQSLGRGLRLNTDKEQCNLFDLTDDLHWKKWRNYALKHGAERYGIYSKEGFPIKLVEVSL